MVRQDPAARVLLWCAGGAALVAAVLWRASAGNPDRFSLIFWTLLTAYDGHANVLLLVLAVCAFLLRGRPAALALVRVSASHPWLIAAALFVLLCAAALRVYHAYPLSMDEYSAIFQAQAFAAGKLGGAFPPDLIDRLIPSFFQGYFLTASRASGEVSASYWPGFALLVAPFAALGAPWAANPAIGALAVPLVHRLALRLGGRDAAGWAVLVCLASPAFVVSSISYYAMSAHLLCNLLFALLLLQPSVPRAALAGLVGSLALTLHNPIPHLLFGAPFVAWLCLRRGSKMPLAALLAGYLPLVLVLGAGWHLHLAGLRQAAVPAGEATPAAAPAASLWQAFTAQLGSLLTVPDMRVVQARIAGLSKMWTWGAAGLLVFAAYGYWLARRETAVRLLGAALAVTFFGYFLVPFDQGHGWGYRYVHSAWFAMPVLAALALKDEAMATLRGFAAWALALSLVLANGLRLVQVESFIARLKAQVPPLARAADPAEPQIVFVNIRAGFYAQDLVQNDPFLRTPRMVMVYDDAQRTAQFMAGRFSGYARRAAGPWGELWTKPAN